MKISIMLPAYNEKGNIEPLTERLIKVFSKKLKNFNYELIFVIQGDDGANESLERLKKRLNIKHMKLLYFPKPIGVGPAHVAGYKNVSKDSDFVLTMDADLNHLPEEFPRFVDKMLDTDADIVIGSRKVKGSGTEKYSLFKRIMSGFTNMLLITFLRLKVKDITSGYRLCRYSVIKKVWPKL
ncbi:MAG: glycosyltransferase family 2 protein, partial [Candidatus Woesearchaeota archaeon]